jgi:hypothetical protein
MPNITPGFERSIYRGFEACVLSSAMDDVALGQFVRTTICGVHALTSPTATVETALLPTQTIAQPAIPATTASQSNATAGATRRSRQTGEVKLENQIYEWLIGQGSAQKRADILNFFGGKGYQKGSVSGALNDLKKANRALSQNGLWEAIRENAQTTTAPTTVTETVNQAEPRTGTMG